MHGFTLTDLDADPRFVDQVLTLFRGCGPGHNHAVCGEPSRMGCRVLPGDLAATLGVLIVHRQDKVVGALAICPYSDEQVTLWGPVVHRAFTRMDIGSYLLQEAKLAIADGGYESIRVNVDTRNRAARAFLLGKGLSAWKDNCVYERNLLEALPPTGGGVGVARADDLGDVADILSQGFPDSSHCDEPLQAREREGYRYHLFQDSGTVLGAAAIKVTPGRNWVSLFAIRPDYRGLGYGRRMLAGILHNELGLGATRLGLEVLADNRAAIAIYEGVGFRRAWTATIMTGPV